jgi:hypothetical protein
MTILISKRGPEGKRGFPFQGRWLPEGTEVDTRDFPRVSAVPGKWDLMIDAGFFEDPRERELDPSRAARRERLRARASRPDPVVPIDRPTPFGPSLDERDAAWVAATLDKPIALQCGECGKQMKNEHGLKIHVSRSHKKE